jgi:hypothetical protein
MTAYRLRMGIEGAGVGSLQLMSGGFETTERFRGDIARELLDLRGRGMIWVLDARFFHSAPNGYLTEIDIGPLLAEQPEEQPNPIARLLHVNGGGRERRSGGAGDVRAKGRLRAGGPAPPNGRDRGGRPRRRRLGRARLGSASAGRGARSGWTIARPGLPHT